MDAHWAAQSNLPRILSLTGLVHGLALITVGLRIYVRSRLLRTPGLDDAVIIIATLLALGGWICFVLEGYHGLGRHIQVFSKQDRITFDKISFAQSIISAIGALGMLKISIALFLMRLSKNKWYTRSLGGLIGFIVFYTVGAWLTFFLRCHPMAKFWDARLVGTCYSVQLFKAFAVANTGCNLGTDVLSASLPIPIVWSLQMSRRTRIYLIGVLSLGYIAVAMGIVKAIYQLSYGADPDRTFNFSVQFWGFMQLNVGIIAASIPTLRSLLRKGNDSTSRNQYDRFNDHDRPANATIGSAVKIPRSRKTDMHSLQMDGDEEFEMSRDVSNKSKRGAQARVYSVNEDMLGSKDRILRTRDESPKGIRRTTEVVIDTVENNRRT